MSGLTVASAAKINLSLDVVGKREDGYHLLETVMQSIDLFDRIELHITEQPNKIQEIKLTDSDQKVPTDPSNTAWRAASLFLASLNKKNGRFYRVQIDLQKRIPVGAGLGGSSADAAGVLVGLNHLCGQPLTDAELNVLATSVGADVPFMLTGGTSFCRGIGEIIEPLPAWIDLTLLLCCPHEQLLTAHVFSEFDLAASHRRPQTTLVVEAVQKQNADLLATAAANVLESVALANIPLLAGIKSSLKQKGAWLAQVSGSGPAVFGIFPTGQTCDEARIELEREYRGLLRLYRCNTIARGTELI